MARVTVEDCIVRIPNRFELVMLASRRARAISAGEPLEVEPDNDKVPVIALREIGDGKIDLDALRTLLILGLQKQIEMDEPEEDNMAALMSGKEWSEAIGAGEGAETDGKEIVPVEPGEEMGGSANADEQPAPADEEKAGSAKAE